MATKKRVSFDDHHGLYHRTIGLDRNGRKPKFWLGDEERQAEHRSERLERLWDQVEADWSSLPNEYTNWPETEVLQKPDKPLWDDITLGAAKALAKGETAFPLPRNSLWSPYKYTQKITDLQRRFNSVQFVPVEEEQRFHEIGFDLHESDAKQEIEAGHQKLALIAGHAAGQTLHQAFDAYIAYLEKLPDLSGWYHTQIKQTYRLKENHPDVVLAQVGLSKIEEMVDFWRHRPVIKKKTIAATTARNQIIQLNMVMKWADRSDLFSWQRPRGFEDIKQTIKDAEEDRQQVVEPFTVDELKTLWQHASPLVRLEMLLALNSGFKHAEIASLTLLEIHLNVPYPGIVRTDRPEGLGNWITRIRRKTKVYGEWELWPWTVDGIEWAKTNRKHPINSPTDYLLVTKSGRPLDARTSGKNKSDKIYSSWQNLYRTIGKHQLKCRYLPFKNLEKTSTDWIRTKFGGEVANLFTCHGKPVKNDTQLEAYSNKPYPRLFEALVALADYLRPVFETVAQPWEVKRTTIPLEKIAQIKKLRAAGKKLTDIAAEVGLHWVTVGKICRQNR